MTSSNRREFLTQAAALIAASGLPVPALAQAKPKLVVVGGGPGGATIAKYVARDSNGAVEVTLVEPLRQFITCFHSNLYLGGFRGWESMLHSYDALASKYGVKLVHQAAQAIDRDKKSVRLADGTQLAYDRLVVAPGIDLKFESVPGYSEAAAQIMPHAWKPGPQTQLLKRQLDAVEDGGVIVMVAPPNPYRCPPGPVRARLDDGARAQGQRPPQFAHHRARPQGHLLQAGLCSRKAGRSTIPAWSSGRIRRCTAASSAWMPRR